MHGLRRRLLPRRLPAGQPDPGVERARRRRRLADRHRAAARHEQLPGVHRLAVPGPVRGVLRPRPSTPTRSRSSRSSSRSSTGPGTRAGSSPAARRAHRQAGRRHRLRTGRPGLRPAAHPGRPRRGRLRALRPARRPAALRHPRLQDAQGPHRPAARPAGAPRAPSCAPASTSAARADSTRSSCAPGSTPSCSPPVRWQPRDLEVPGRELGGVHQAMDYLPLANRVRTGDLPAPPDRRGAASRS